MFTSDLEILGNLPQGLRDSNIKVYKYKGKIGTQKFNSQFDGSNSPCSLNIVITP